MQKPFYVLWKIWVNQPLFHSDPSWWFVLQPLFILFFYPWFLFLLIAHPAKPLSPGEWTHWRILSSCNGAFPFLSKINFLTNLNWQVSAFDKLTSPLSYSSKETLIWRFGPPQVLPRCLWHSVKHLVCMSSFDMILVLHCDLAPLYLLACPLIS